MTPTDQAFEEREGSDILAESIELCRILEVDASQDYDLLATARQVMADLRNARAEIAAQNAQLAVARAGLSEWRRLYINVKERENTWTGADADLCRRLTRENKELRDRITRTTVTLHTALRDVQRPCQGLVQHPMEAGAVDWPPDAEEETP